MPYPKINPASTQALKYFTIQLAHAMRARDRFLDNGVSSFGFLLDSTSGHVHDGSRVNSYSFYLQDVIQTYTSGTLQNNKFDFRYGGGATSFAQHTATIAADPSGVPRTITDYIAALQAGINSEIGSGKVEVKYFDPLIYGDYSAAGRIRIRHLGTTDTPNARRLELPFLTGTNQAASCSKALRFLKSDRAGNLFYLSDFGWYDGVIEDLLSFGDGGQVGESGIADANGTDQGATYAKYGSHIFTAAKIAANAVIAGKIKNKAVSARVIGDLVHSNGGTQSVSSGATVNFDFDMSQNRYPACSYYIVSGGSYQFQNVFSHIGGPAPFGPANRYRTSYQNNSPVTLGVFGVAL